MSLVRASFSGEQFKQFKQYHNLNWKLESTENGLRVYYNEFTNDIDTVLVAGIGYSVKGVTYKSRSSLIYRSNEIAGTLYIS